MYQVVGCLIHRVVVLLLLSYTISFPQLFLRIYRLTAAAALGGCLVSRRRFFVVVLFWARECLACGCDSSLKFIFDNINNTEVIFNK